MATKRFGKALTERSIKRESLLGTAEIDSNKTNLPSLSRAMKRNAQAKLASIAAPTLIADDKKIDRKKKKVSYADRLRSGRISTVLSETLG